jgi:ATP phosphoribosyltransferase
LVAVLPCMKSPTVQELFGNGGGFAVKVALLEKDIRTIIPLAKAAGATDIIEYDLKKVVL